ncbi:hypothetical protein L484_024119 [Morus notabilis]|uniref:Uncharacterized protein n=1 Tax=Morus notabilis TaxID=981085 RepID=W9SEG0_9ROSA|nr:hypothetical protein L484_024119 [Morus notabilis]
MNSMFSVFDAFCAEVLLGKTTSARAHSVFAGDAKPSQRNDGAPEKTTGKKSDGNREFSEKTKTKIRSALEFDGLNCFETFVSY